MIDPLISSFIGLCFALLFGMAGVHKLRAPLETQQLIEQYQVMPRSLAAPARWMIPSIESAVALGLVFPGTRMMAAVAGAFLLAVYAAAMTINLYRGRRDLDCGCSIGGTPQVVTEFLVVRNVLLAACLLVVTLPVSGRVLGAMDGFTLGASVLAAGILYTTVNTLIENQTKRI